MVHISKNISPKLNLSRMQLRMHNNIIFLFLSKIFSIYFFKNETKLKSLPDAYGLSI